MVISTGSMLKGQYRIDALIGGGGMATVYRAYDLNLQRVCAIKQNMDASPEAQRQFHLEAVLLAKLSHPHLARVTDHFFDTTGQQYLVMDFVEGENLETLVARTGALPEAQLLAWMAGVLDAVSYCHGQGVIHRDIKPANLVKRRGQDEVVLVDFGIAKQEWGGMTMTGARAATPAYAPLEQFTGHTDARSDIYSLGATLYYLLTGHEPPDSRLVASGVASVTPPRSYAPRISPATEQAVLQAMALRVGDRPQTVAQFQAALVNPAKLLVGPVQTSKPASHRRPALIGLLVVVIVAASAGLVVAFMQLVNGPSRVTPTATRAPITSTDVPEVEMTVHVSPTLDSTVTRTVVAGLTIAVPATDPLQTETPGAVGTRPATSTAAATETPTPHATSTPRPTLPPTPSGPAPTNTPQPPLSLAPALIGPENGTVHSGQVLLAWSFGLLGPEQSYRVTLRTEQNQEPKAINLDPTTRSSILLRFDTHPEFFTIDNTTYWWSVVVLSPDGQPASQSSAERSFVFRQEASQPPVPEPPTPEPPTPEPPTLEPPPTPRA
ncbi:MAG: serine/threonine protein kinase [Anaerolineae bacterium]|nr:serine/threonine protein kinase [Anaerolineae bacterium]MCB0203862.1 serine/threonine protein kinase [Anaerolineae bacterium]MCB0256647.1 serine/threonine protein kinase [Anaerolineae bacterium]